MAVELTKHFIPVEKELFYSIVDKKINYIDIKFDSTESFNPNDILVFESYYEKKNTIHSSIFDVKRVFTKERFSTILKEVFENSPNGPAKFHFRLYW